MQAFKIRFSDVDKTSGQHTDYEIDPVSLSPYESDRLNTLLERSGILELQGQHRGPAEGEHELIITMETADGPSHEICSCDVRLSADQEELADFIQECGHEARLPDKSGT